MAWLAKHGVRDFAIPFTCAEIIMVPAKRLIGEVHQLIPNDGPSPVF